MEAGAPLDQVTEAGLYGAPLHYAAGKAATVFTMQQGMVDRGADLQWLSQCARRRRQPGAHSR